MSAQADLNHDRAPTLLRCPVRRRPRRPGVLVLLPMRIARSADGLGVRGSGRPDPPRRLGRKGDSLIVATTVRNTRAQDVQLDADQCGRVTEVVLARTVFEPEGETYDGSLGAVKELVLDGQRFVQNPNRFHPRRLTGGTDIPECIRPEQPVLAPGQPSRSVGAALRLRVRPRGGRRGEHPGACGGGRVRARPTRCGFLDILPTGEAEDAARDRNVRVESRPRRCSSATGDENRTNTLSDGQRFDRIIEDDGCASSSSAQPAKFVAPGQPRAVGEPPSCSRRDHRLRTRDHRDRSTEGNHVSDLQTLTRTT